MKLRLPLMFLLLGSLVVRAQDEFITLPDLIEGVQEWADDNLDPAFLDSLPELEEQQVQRFLRNLQQQLQGEYIIDLAALREAANAVLPVLKSYEETQPYAAWLETRLDYLKVADDFRLIIPAPATEPGKPVRPAPNPGALQQRQVWVREVANRPWPPAASNYVTRLKPIFTAEKVPPELVWLAEVESSFNPHARSPVGATGLFQLMPATAQRFGLTLWPRDQRLQPDPSARASAQYLKFLHGKFKDWRLALAAYNAGEGTVERLLKRHNTRSFEGIAVHLPAETQMYVPKVEAVLRRREGLTLANLSLP